ncbi:hypothetical protein B484DRAFT_79172, partial [Ochromonadaceae sp. CCMP2298]
MSGGSVYLAPIQFIGAISLLVTTSVAYLFNGRAYAPDATPNQSFTKASGGLGQDGNGGPYLLRYRTSLWLRQLLQCALIVSNAYNAIKHLSDGDGVASNFGRVLFVLAMLLVLLADEVRNLGHWRRQRAWLPAYTVILLQTVAVFAASRTHYALFEVVLASGVVVTAVLSAAVDAHRAQKLQPPAEYTCGLFSSWTFGYLNRVLISPSMQKESLELEDVPTLCDNDSSAPIW